MRVVYSGKGCYALTPGQTYTVLGISIITNENTLRQHRLEDRFLFLIARDPLMWATEYPASAFQVVDARLSRYWVWASVEGYGVELSHPAFAGTDLLQRLFFADVDDYAESYDRDVALYRSALWDLLNKFGVLPHEKPLLGITEVEERLAELRDCLSLEDPARQSECLARLFQTLSVPERWEMTSREEQAGWGLLEYAFGLFVSGQLTGNRDCQQELRDHLEGRRPFLGVSLRVPRLWRQAEE
jgi:hypothetical protein